MAEAHADVADHDGLVVECHVRTRREHEILRAEGLQYVVVGGREAVFHIAVVAEFFAVALGALHRLAVVALGDRIPEDHFRFIHGRSPYLKSVTKKLTKERIFASLLLQIYRILEVGSSLI